MFLTDHRKCFLSQKYYLMNDEKEKYNSVSAVKVIECVIQLKKCLLNAKY